MRVIDNILSLQNVDFTLKGPTQEIKILSSINFSASAGSSVALIGPSGSGKSSLVMLMAGLDLPTSGEVWVAGKNIVAMSEDERASFRAEHIGILFQSFHLVPTMTALENCILPLEFSAQKNMSSKQRKEKAEAELERVGLAARVNHYPAQMSGGEQQRVALARALIATPALLLADEPTGNLDEENSERMADLLFSIQQENNTCLIMVTHDSKLAGRCDSVMEMHNGRLS